MPQTLAQKLIARACGRDRVEIGEIVTCEVDLAMFHDSSGPRRLAPMLDELGARIRDPERIVLVMDHFVSADDPPSRRIVEIARSFARDQRLRHVHDREGICHVVLPEQGHIRPGMFCVGGDSHSPTAGAFGAYMFGIGSTEMLGVVVTGSIWLRVPKTIRYHWHGRLADGVMAKDMILHLLGRFGLDGGDYQAIEFAGTAIEALSMPERMTLSNMGAELGAQAALVAPDAITRDWLLAHGVAAESIDIERWHTDPGASYAADHRLEADVLEPQIARPHSPANVDRVSAAAGEPIDVAYIGACTGAKLTDMQAAARVLAGRRIAAGTSLLLAPASVRALEQARGDGTLATLVDAGARLLPSACGACAGYRAGMPDDARVISTTARNFRGRMGSDGAKVWLGSPYTVAASAVLGRIADPRELLAESRP
ncbi:MAG: 3-isopropylmalate dehydratase large subunit [Burkholderiaceae bacterium]